MHCNTQNKKGMKIAFSLCIPVFAVILLAYFFFKDIFDFSKVTKYDFIELKITNINKTATVYCNTFVYNGTSMIYICGSNESNKAISQSVTIEAMLKDE